MGYLAILTVIMTAYILITEQRLDTMCIDINSAGSGAVTSFELGMEAYDLAEAAYNNTQFLGKYVGILNEEGVPRE